MVTMSQKELQRVKVIENAVAGRLRVSEAARLLQLSERQVQRLKRRYRPDSVAWVHHGNRGRPMPWALPAALRRTILELARGQYRDFNDSHLCQKLHTEENLVVSRETVRRILRRAKLASPQKRRPRKYRARRLRRPRFGMMVLTDASRHDWLEGRGPELTLIGFQDDATSQILSAHFQLEAENTLGYMRAVHAMVSTHGVPLSVYRDRHGIFQRNDPHWTLAEQLAGKQCPTHLGRALEELGIQQIPAYSPRPKAASNAPGAPARTVWSVNSASLTPAISTPPTKFSPASAPTTTNASPFLPARLSATSAPCPRASISTAASVSAISAWSAPTTSSPSAPAPSRSPPCLPNAVMPGPPSNSPIAWMAGYSSLIGRFCCCLCLGRCRCRNFPQFARLLASPPRKQKNRCPASTTSAVAPPSLP
jgi:transposase